MSYKQQFWNDYDENKTETQNIENGAVVTSERMNHIENGIVVVDNRQSILEIDIQNTQSGFLGDFNSVQALYSTYPSGAKGYAVVWVTENSKRVGYTYTYKNKAWTKGAIWNGMGIPDKSVGREKLTDRFMNEINLYSENNLENNFELLNANFFQLGVDMYWYARNLGSIRDILLTGFDQTKEHRLRFFARNHSAFKYRFIICSRNDKNSPWVDVFDTGRDFTIIENPEGLTYVAATIGVKTVELKINYLNMDYGDAINDGMLGNDDGRYKLKTKCFYQNTLKSVQDELTIIKDDTVYDKVVVLKKGNNIKVKYKKNKHENEVIEFNELGINKIIHPKRIYRENSTSLNSNFLNIDLFYTLYTDWISPYQKVKALSGGINSSTVTVGGNHGTNGADGFPTAKNIDVEVMIDNRLVNDDKIASGKVAMIVVKNVISAPNKINLTTGEKAESLLETVIYKVTENNIEVFVNVKALEEIEVGGYVGLQMTTDIIKNGQVYFLDGPTKYSVDSILHPSAPLPFKNDRMIFENESDVVVIQTKRDYGIGDLKFKGTAPIHFMSEFNKLYSHLVNETVTLKKGESIDYSGSYTFMNKMKCNGAEAAYFFVENEETIYCVDFFESIEKTFLEMPLSTVGKKVTIVDSKNVEIQDVISFEGLKLKSTGLGFVKFRVNN